MATTARSLGQMNKDSDGLPLTGSVPQNETRFNHLLFKAR